MSKLTKKPIKRDTFYKDVPDSWIHEGPPELQIKLQAKFIPDGAKVTKEKGSKIYTLQSSVKIVPYVETDNDEIIKQPTKDIFSEGCLFLVESFNNFYIIQDDTVLCWIVDVYDMDTLMYCIECANEGIPQ